MAITRLWFFTLKPDNSARDPAFLSLWTNILELCAMYTPSPRSSCGSGLQMALSTPPKRSHHFLFQSASDESLLVLISSYPSMALCRQADAAYSKRHKDEVLRHVYHTALRQLDIEDAETVPALLEAGEVSVTFSRRDPLTLELVESRSSSGSGAPVPPPTQEISGPDSSEMPLIPGVDFGDVLAAQKSEEKKWISISRGKSQQHVDDEQVFRLTQVLAR
ncbi:hypothetical protein KVR01_002418 [Diaporthe batatas]|uniref:uncharacterized protein n=1 Tax=Diaporthe batatas TaxID=748121 RepID=UPI001D0404A9|nr:uncharacterized protein KVR01_002418 [Diaporthe batatas]KAG8166729.1 hypothetical protein KVR01_002418 [Diaporthe batatas]